MIISGKVKVIKSPRDYYEITEPIILVAKNTTPDVVIIMDKILGIVTEVDNRLCHAAILAREYNKPLIMGVVGATKKYCDGQELIIDTTVGKIC